MRHSTPATAGRAQLESMTYHLTRCRRWRLPKRKATSVIATMAKEIVIQPPVVTARELFGAMHDSSNLLV